MKIATLFALFLAASLNAQNLVPSNTYVRTCLNDVECSSINSSSHIFYDEAKAQFYLKLDFNAMKTGQDSVDFWLNDLSDTYFFFKASLPREQFPNLSSYNAKTFKMDGQAFLNNIWRHQVIDISIYRAENDLINNSTNANKFDAYKVNFSFSFQPKEFNIHKKPQRLTNTIFVGVGGGQINLLKAGMENQVGEAYSHE
jgi:hypothetical protein